MSATSTQPTVALVTGATGFVGGHLVEHLRAAGVRTRVLIRDPRRWHGHAEEVICGDLDDRVALREAVRGVDHVYHVAGLTKALRKGQYFGVNHLGTVRLLEACREENSRLRRFILVSSQAAAGPALDGVPVRETDAPHPVSEYGLSKLKAEQAAEAFGRLFPVTVIRPPVVYGPRDRDTLLVFRVARRGLIPQLGRLGAFSLIHVHDLVRGIVLAAFHPRAENRCYFMSNTAHPTLRQLAEPIAQEFGARAFSVPLPGAPLPVLGALAEALSSVVGRTTPLTRNKVREVLARSWLCDTSRAAEELGWRAEIALADGIRGTTRWYREVGWL